MIEAGYCMVCNSETHSKCPSCGTKKFNAKHTEVEMQWSNGAKMKVGVCVPCAKANKWATEEAKAKITKAHHDHWEETGGKVDRSVKLV